jgi:antitoxin component YwqK of YwqJK toxin-antitoxin module
MKKYYQTGKIMEEAEYNTNVLDGFYRHYSETGVIDLEYSYKNGEKISGGIVQPQEAQ